MEREHWNQSSPEDCATSQPINGNHFDLGMHLGETNSHLRALRWEVREIPQQVALHLTSRMPHLATAQSGQQNFFATLRQLTQFLQSGLPYVKLAKLLSLIAMLWGFAIIAIYNPKEMASVLKLIIGSIVGG